MSIPPSRPRNEVASIRRAGNAQPEFSPPSRQVETRFRLGALPSRRIEMALRILTFAFSLAVAASPLSAAKWEPAPAAPAPAGAPDTRYCMHLAPFTGSMIEATRCWTRDEWAEQGVDVDKEW